RFATWPSSRVFSAGTAHPDRDPGHPKGRSEVETNQQARHARTDMAPTRKVVIIGSGPAGYTAAIYAARANLSPMMYTGLQAGGQLMLTPLVENYPGFVEGIDGPPLMETFREQALRFGTEMVAEDVTAVDFNRQPFLVKTDDSEVEAQTVIVATGASAKLIGLESESKLMGRGVSTCATCDGFFFKDQNIMVVGGGDSAMEEALYLSRLGRQVQVVHRRDSLRASKIMQERALKNPKIEFIWDTVVDDVLDPTKNKGTSVRLKNLQTGAGWGDAGGWALGGHRPSAQHRRLQGAARAAPERVREDHAGHDADLRPWRVRGGRRGRFHLSAGGDGGGHRLYGRAGSGALPGGS